MKKKIVSLCLVVALAATAVIGGTLAYFTDNDDASNTFELGGVDITLTEKKYENGTWTEIENPDGTATLGQLDPIVDDWAEVTAAGYAFNKGVFTINNKDAAYIRNYVAIESIGDQTVNNENVGDIYKIWYNNADVENPSEGGKLRHGSMVTEKYEDVGIDGAKYDIYVFDTLGNAVVEKGDSFMTLTTVTLKEWVTNEMVEQLDDQFNIYTWSEAIQETGLTHEEAMAALIGGDNTLEPHATRLLKEVMTSETNE